jgi:hypothetical protein
MPSLLPLLIQPRAFEADYEKASPDISKRRRSIGRDA